jgi:hypothetical protein
VTSLSHRSDIAARTASSSYFAIGAHRPHLRLVARLDPVVLIVRQLDIGRQHTAHDGRGRRAIRVDARGYHVADEKDRIGARARRQLLQRLGHVRAGGVRPHRAVGDLAGERHHPAPQRGEGDRRQGADLRGEALELAHELAHVLQRLARMEAEPRVRGAVTDAHAEAKPTTR